MKKIASFLVALVLMVTSVMPLMAESEYLSKNKEYWLNQAKITNLDQIMAIEAVGLNVEDEANQFELVYRFDQPVSSNGDDLTYEDMDAGYLGKHIIALALMKQDPHELVLAQGETIDLVALLKSKIDETGKVEFGAGNPESSTIYAMMALSIVDGTYDLTKLADQLAKMQLEDGSWGYNGAFGGPDITGWAIVALSLCPQTYQGNIDKAIAYLASVQREDGAYVPNGSWAIANSNTQSCAIWGLLEYDREGVINGKYDNGKRNPYTMLLDFIRADGSFGYSDTNSANVLSTIQASLALGVYENGSIIESARNQYNSIKEETPSIPQENPVPPILDNEVEDQKTTLAVKTDDVANIVNLTGMLVLSLGVYIYLKRAI